MTSHISEELRKEWIEAARKRFQACCEQEEVMIASIIARKGLDYNKQHITTEHLNAGNIKDVLSQLTSDYVKNGKILSFEEMEKLDITSGYSLSANNVGRYDQTLIESRIISEKENQWLSLSDRLIFNTAAFMAKFPPAQEEGINAYNFRITNLMLMGDADENDPDVLALRAERLSFEAEINHMLKQEMDLKFRLIRNAIDLIEEHSTYYRKVGEPAHPSVSVYIDQIQKETLNDQALSIEDKIKVLQALANSIKPAEKGKIEDLGKRFAPIYKIGAEMLETKKNERLGSLLLAFAAVILISACISLAILTAGAATPLAVIGIGWGSTILSGAIIGTGIFVQNKSTSALTKLSKQAYEELKTAALDDSGNNSLEPKR